MAFLLTVPSRAELKVLSIPGKADEGLLSCFQRQCRPRQAINSGLDHCRGSGKSLAQMQAEPKHLLSNAWCSLLLNFSSDASDIPSGRCFLFQTGDARVKMGLLHGLRRTSWWCISAEPAELVLWPPSSLGACGGIHFRGTLRPCTKKAVLPGSAGSPRVGDYLRAERGQCSHPYQTRSRQGCFLLASHSGWAPRGALHGLWVPQTC